jgi:hypothetical protein
MCLSVRVHGGRGTVGEPASLGHVYPLEPGAPQPTQRWVRAHICMYMHTHIYACIYMLTHKHASVCMRLRLTVHARAVGIYRLRGSKRRLTRPCVRGLRSLSPRHTRSAYLTNAHRFFRLCMRMCTLPSWCVRGCLWQLRGRRARRPCRLHLVRWRWRCPGAPTPC